MVTHAEFRALQEALLADANVVLWNKMQDYAADEADALANFRAAAEHLGLEPRQVWAVYFWKHVCSVMEWARRGDVASEPIRGRFVDLVNYCAFGAALAARKESVA